MADKVKLRPSRSETELSREENVKFLRVLISDRRSEYARRIADLIKKDVKNFEIISKAIEQDEILKKAVCMMVIEDLAPEKIRECRQQIIKLLWENDHSFDLELFYDSEKPLYWNEELANFGTQIKNLYIGADNGPWYDKNNFETSMSVILAYLEEFLSYCDTWEWSWIDASIISGDISVLCDEENSLENDGLFLGDSNTLFEVVLPMLWTYIEYITTLLDQKKIDLSEKKKWEMSQKVFWKLK